MQKKQFVRSIGAAIAVTAFLHLPVCAADPDAVADKRARTLLARMTLDEKIQMVHGAGLGSSPLGGGGFIAGIARLGIPDLNMVDTATGINAGVSGATAFPSPLAIAASWDKSLAHDLGAVIGKEARTLGFAITLGTGVNLAREPRNGRTFEYMGEDPVLAGTMLTQRTLGTQAQNVVATAKHLVGNEHETNRFGSDSIISERALHQLYLLPFEMTVKAAQPGYVMCAYNKLNGEQACESKRLITDTLKNAWGFKGVVQSDWIFGLTDTRRGADAGLDEEQPGSKNDNESVNGLPPSHFNQKLKAAVSAGVIAESRLDDMVFRKLRTLYRYGIMDAPPVKGHVDKTAGEAMAQKAAAESMVLLKNAGVAGSAGPVLPIAPSIRSIVVIGGHADVAVMHGGGSASIAPQDGNPVTCLKPGTSYDPFGVFSKCAPWFKSSPLDAIRAKAPAATVTYLDGSDAGVAASAAASADMAIVFATQFTSENMDLASLDLPDAISDPANQAYDQNALIAAVAQSNSRTVVVLETGTAVKMPWLTGTPAVLQAWYPGVRGGQAIADILFGTVNPSGKLPITFPLQERDLPQPAIPQTDKTVNYAEDLNMGYRWFDAKGIAPLFAFGHGLSYTNFSYSGVATTKKANGDVVVRVRLKNVGVRAGAEVVQLYATLPVSAGEPPLRLVAWDKVGLRPGQTREVSITVEKARFGIWNALQGKFEVPRGDYGLQVGGSSRPAAAMHAKLRF